LNFNLKLRKTPNL